MPDGNLAPVPDGVSHFSFAIQRPGIFGLNTDDMEFYYENPGESARQEAILDRILAMGCGGIMSTNTQEPAYDTPAMMVELSSKNEINRENRHGMLSMMFWRESYPMNDRMIKFIREHSLIVPKKMDVLMVEWSTQRKWGQTVESFLLGYQFSKDPSKGVRCVRCGQGISREELIATNKCPRCNLMLA